MSIVVARLRFAALAIAIFCLAFTKYQPRRATPIVTYWSGLMSVPPRSSWEKMEPTYVVALIGASALALVNVAQLVDSRLRERRQTRAEEQRREADAQHEMARLTAMHEHERSMRQFDGERRIREIWSAKRYEALLGFLKNASAVTSKLQNAQMRWESPNAPIPEKPSPPDDKSEEAVRKYKSELDEYINALDARINEKNRGIEIQRTDLDALAELTHCVNVLQAGQAELNVFASQRVDDIANEWLGWILKAVAQRKGLANQEAFDESMRRARKTETVFVECLKSELGTAQPLADHLDLVRKELNKVHYRELDGQAATGQNQ